MHSWSRQTLRHMIVVVTGGILGRGKWLAAIGEAPFMGGRDQNSPCEALWLRGMGLGVVHGLPRHCWNALARGWNFVNCDVRIKTWKAVPV